MSVIDGSGPAFPVSDSPYSLPTSGMSLRDYFAAQSLGGLLAGDVHLGNPVDAAFTAEIAYRISDAMLAHRSKQ